MNNTYLSVPDACALSCNKCVSTQRSNEMNSLPETNDDTDNVTMIVEEYTTESTTSIVVEPAMAGLNIIFSRSVKCFDTRDDCLLQKQYGFCPIFNEKYPYDCAQTCNPNCASQS